MFRKRTTKPLPAGAKLAPDGKTAKIRVRGQLRTVELAGPGRMVLYSAKYYADIGGRHVPLAEDHDEARRMELELLLAHKQGEKKQRAEPTTTPRSRQEIADLIEDWVAIQYGPESGFHPAHIHGFRTRVRLLLDAGITTAAHLQAPDAGDRIARALADLSKPGKPIKLSGTEFAPGALAKALEMSRSNLNRFAQNLGITGTGLKRAKRYSREEAERIASAQASGLAPGTVHGHRVAISAFCRWLLKRGIITRMPDLPRVSAQPKVIRPRRAITVETLRQLVDSVRTRRRILKDQPAEARAVLYSVAFYTGLRLRALREARCGDVLRGEAGAWSFGVRASTDKTRTARRIPLPPDVGAALGALTKGRSKDALIWPGLPVSFSGSLKTDLRDANIPFVLPEGRVDFHAFRHSFASHFIARGVSPLVVARAAGWANLTQLQRRYGHLDAAMGDLMKGGW